MSGRGSARPRESRALTFPLFCCSEGGFFRAVLTFPSDYPLRPPKMRFTSQMWHPNGELRPLGRSR